MEFSGQCLPNGYGLAETEFYLEFCRMERISGSYEGSK